METITEKQHSELKARCGSHEAVAKELGISPRHYLRIRKGQHVTPMVVKLVKYLLNGNEGRAA